MTIYPFGLITVPTPGTPVALPVPTTPFKVHRLVWCQHKGSAGATYAGIKTMVKGTGVGVIKEFQAPAASGLLDDHEIASDCNSNDLDASIFAVDADTANDGLIVYGEIV